MSVLRTGRGVQVGGGGWNFELKKNAIKKCSWGLKTHAQNNLFFGGGGDFGAPHAPTRGSRGVGKRYTSSYDHDM